MRRMVREALPTVSYGAEPQLDKLAKMNDGVDALYGEIFAYLSHLSREELLERQSIRLSNYMIVANYTKSISARISTSLVDAGKEKTRNI
jgi:Na+/phosphate symporter